MRLLSVVDATPATGLGRLARTLAVGEALRTAGHEHVIAGALTAPYAGSLAEEAGVAVLGAPTTAAGVQELAAAHHADWVLVDRPRPPAGLHDHLSAAGIRTAAFADHPSGDGAPAADLLVRPEWAPDLLAGGGDRRPAGPARTRLRPGAGRGPGGQGAPPGPGRWHGRPPAAARAAR